MTRWISRVLIFSLLSFSSAGQAQTGKSVKRGVATVFFATLGGAVLGLSTLSFYGEPQEHTGNISMGALMGAIAGAGFLAYDYSKPMEKPYDYTQTPESDLKNKRALAVFATTPLMISYRFEF